MKLPLLQLADWDREKTYDEDPPQCIHYSIEWKVTIKGKRGVHVGTRITLAALLAAKPRRSPKEEVATRQGCEMS